MCTHTTCLCLNITWLLTAAVACLSLKLSLTCVWSSWDSCRPSHWSWVTQTQKSGFWEIKMTIPRVTYFLMLLALKMSLPEHLTLDGNLTHHTTQLTKWIIPARTEFSVITYVLLPYTHMHIRIPSKRWLYLLCWRSLALLFSHKSPVDLLLGRRHYTAVWNLDLAERCGLGVTTCASLTHWLARTQCDVHA